MEEVVEGVLDVLTVVDLVVDTLTDVVVKTELDLRVVVIKSVDTGEIMPDEAELVVDEITMILVPDTDPVGILVGAVWKLADVVVVSVVCTPLDVVVLVPSSVGAAVIAREVVVGPGKDVVVTRSEVTIGETVPDVVLEVVVAR